MAWVKTFRVTSEFGVPDKEIRAFLEKCEKDAIINVTTLFIPALGGSDPRLNVIVTELDDRK